ncbi:MAG: peptide ABC transporter substrate-binding protein [Anaerolineales bacterium]|nr:peptide ABC transporter substrate-binding protein [Anaerolineales bacterium]
MVKLFRKDASGKKTADRGRRSVVIGLFLIIAASLLVSASAPATLDIQIGVPLDQAIVYSGGESANLRDYDPATTYSAGDKLVFSGLVSLDTNLNIRPDLAETWEVSADGTVYTFHIHPNAKFHDGRDVTAQDVVFSWERAASPELQSDTVLTYMGDIVGVREMVLGEANSISGLKVIDEKTLQVTIDAPKPYFLMKLTFPTSFIVDEGNVSIGEEWVRQPNGTGPYKLREWKSYEYIVYEANPDFYLGAPSIPYVVYKLYAGDDVRLFETGEVDLAGVGLYDVERMLDPNEPLNRNLVSGVNLCTNYVTFDATQPPFDDVNVRKAFSMAFDRQRYIDVLYRGLVLPAVGLYPPGLPGFDYGLEGLPFDPEGARELLKQSKYGGPEGLPEIVYTNSGIGSYVGGSVAALADMWQQYLGVTIKVENLDYNFYYEQIFSGNHGQIFDGGWCADYPDPENFADVLFHSGVPQNHGGYSNPELDALLESARVEPDVTRRIDMYQQAERILVDDAPVLFLTHSLSYQLVQPYVKGFVYTPISISLERYMWLEGK